MPWRSGRAALEAALLAAALGAGGAAALGAGGDRTVADALYFAAWCAAMGLLFSLGLRLPLHLRGRLARPAGAAVALAAIGLTVLGNIALYRHDAHFDITVSGRYTAPPELETIAGSLRRDVLLTYFYNGRDEYADAARQVLAVVARRHPHLRVRALDLDTELVAARNYGVRLYNTAIVETEGRRAQVEDTVDLRQVAYAIERVLKKGAQTVCFVAGHGERYAPGHVHLSHVETLGGDAPGGAGVLEAPLDGIDRLKLAIETIGYGDRAIEPATAAAIPADCAVVADIGPRSAYAPAEIRLLRDYLSGGGRALLAYDPQFPLAPELASLLGEVGLAIGDGVVVDPTNHYGTDQEQAAVPYYPPHPITAQVALSVFPGARPIRLIGPVAGVAAAGLAATSKDSYVRPLNPTAAGGLAGARPAPPRRRRAGDLARDRPRPIPPGAGRQRRLCRQRLLPLRLERRPRGCDDPLARRRHRDAAAQAYRLQRAGIAADPPADAGDLCGGRRAAAARRHAAGRRRLAAAPVRLSPANGVGVAAACLMAGLIGAIAVSGRWPVDAPRAHVEAGGILPLAVERVARVEIAQGDERLVLSRGAGGDWLVNDAPAGPAVANHIAAALRLLAVSPPRRTLAAGEYSADELAQYGLEPPRLTVAVAAVAGSEARIAFGEATPAQNAQYVRILGRPELYLLPRDVGGEWRLARDMAMRPAGLLLPVSIAQIWAVELVSDGALHRFERDPAGLWFHHVGEHAHLPGGFVHKADPKLAPLIAAGLDALDRLPIAHRLDRHPDAAALGAAGLAHPATIMLLYGRDSFGPVARVELGAAAADGSGRYARLGQGGALLTVPAAVEPPLAALLQLAGAS